MKPSGIMIGHKAIGEYRPTYIIAEIGSNHNQSLDRALEMIERSAECGADAVKFQSIRFDKLYHPDCETQAFRHWIEQIELDEKWYHSLAARCRQCQVDFISSPTYADAIPLLEDCQVPAYKLASPQVQANLPLVKAVAKTQKPLIMSMGYSSYGDIENALLAAAEVGNHSVIPLHCISKYPMMAEEANLRYINTLQAMTGCPVGFSDHSLGFHLTLAAVALGACVIEKHVTTDRLMAGPDHHFSMLFSELETMIRHIRELDQALGSGIRMQLLPEECKYRDSVKLKLFAAKHIAAGESIMPHSVQMLRCQQAGVDAGVLNMDVCFRAGRNIAAGEQLQWRDLIPE